MVQKSQGQPTTVWMYQTFGKIIGSRLPTSINWWHDFWTINSDAGKSLRGGSHGFRADTLAARLPGDSLRRLPAGCLCQSEGKRVEWRGSDSSVFFCATSEWYNSDPFVDVYWLLLTPVDSCPSHCRKRPDANISATKVLHSSNHLHRDLKPQNILLSDCFWAQVPQVFGGRGDLEVGYIVLWFYAGRFIHCLYILWLSLKFIHCSFIVLHCLYTLDVMYGCVFVLDGHRHGFFWFEKTTSKKRVFFLCSINATGLCEVRPQTVQTCLGSTRNITTPCVIIYDEGPARLLKWLIL